jgi:zinc protease
VSALAELARRIDPDSVRAMTLSNGLRVLVRRDDSAPVVAIVTYVKAGYFDETDDVAGIAHVLEHMYFKGTPTRGVGEIAKQTKAAGGYLNAGTIYDHTSYYTVLPASGFREGLAVQADAYANSVIDADELARELEVIIQEAKRKEDNPGAVVVETLYELLHDRHRIRRWRIGREEGLRRLTRSDLLRFYQNFYRPASTILSIVGAVDEELALREVERRYGGLPATVPERSPGPREEGPSGFRYREWAGDIAQSQIALGWRTPAMDHPDTPLLDLAAAVLGTGRGSRLYRAVRDRELVASVSAFNYTPTELGVFTISAEAPPEKARPALEAVWAQVRDLPRSLGDVELERAKRVYEARWIRSLEDMEGQANHLAEWEALGDWRRADDYLNRVLSAAGGEIRRTVEEHLSAEHVAIAIYRPEDTAAVVGDAGTAREVVDRAAGTILTPPGAVVPAPSATGTVELEKLAGRIHVFRTPSGLPVLVRLKPGASLVHIAVQFAGGAVHEPADRAGTTALMVRAALKGTARMSSEQIALGSEMLGGAIAGGAVSESFGWSMSVPAARLRAASALLAEVVERPVFPEDAVNVERAIAIADVASLRDDMFRYPLRLLQSAAFEGHPYGVPVSGTEVTLGEIDAAALRDWHTSQVLRGAAVLAVVGDGDPAELARAAAASFGAIVPSAEPLVPFIEWSADTRFAVEELDKAQTALAVAFAGPDRRGKDRYAAELLTNVASGLGGRFFEELRDRQSLCYTVHAYHLERRLAGAMVAYIATSPEKEEIARAGLLREFQRFREEPVTAEELHRAQRYAIGTHAISQQHGGVLLAEMTEAWLLGSLDELGEYEREIESVDVDALVRLADRYFDPDRRAEGIVRGRR